MTDQEAREMARGLVRGSIIEDAAAQFIAQVLKEAHDSRIKPMRARIEELEAKLSKAMLALEEIAGNGNATGRNPQLMADKARTTLAELKGKDDD
jgi:ferritin-like protein